jgi:hypothetical protein
MAANCKQPIPANNSDVDVKIVSSQDLYVGLSTHQCRRSEEDPQSSPFYSLSVVPMDFVQISS